MKRKIFFACIFSAIPTQNIFAKNAPSIQCLNHAIEATDFTENKTLKGSQIPEEPNIPSVDELNKKVHKLSNQLGALIARVKNKKDKKVLVQLVQKIQTADSSEKTISSKSKMKSNKNNRSDRKDTFDILKNLTTQTAIVAYAAIICLAITKKILDTGEISRILEHFKLILEQVVTLEKLRLAGQSITYIMQGLLYYASLGYGGKAF